MSSATRCNWHVLQDMKGRAAEREVEVIVERESDWHASPESSSKMTLGSGSVWWTARYSDQEKPSAYFMLLTDGCVC